MFTTLHWFRSRSESRRKRQTSRQPTSRETSLGAKPVGHRNQITGTSATLPRARVYGGTIGKVLGNVSGSWFELGHICYLYGVLRLGLVPRPCRWWFIWTTWETKSKPGGLKEVAKLPGMSLPTSHNFLSRVFFLGGGEFECVCRMIPFYSWPVSSHGAWESHKWPHLLRLIYSTTSCLHHYHNCGVNFDVDDSTSDSRPSVRRKERSQKCTQMNSWGSAHTKKIQGNPRHTYVRAHIQKKKETKKKEGKVKDTL